MTGRAWPSRFHTERVKEWTRAQAGEYGKTRLSRVGQARVFGDQAFSRARVRVVRSQTSVGPKYWMAPG